MNKIENWGRLYSIFGESLRDATEHEWRESYASNLRYGSCGWISVSYENEVGQNTTMLANVIGGPDHG
jgi:hypothetical protein